MAVNVNTVYQKVLAISNKEQRGYITPQEFNLFADKAQLYIFEQYFYDLDRFLRVPGNDTVYADRISIIEETVTMSSNVGTLPSGIYRLGKVFYLENGKYVEIALVPQNKLYSFLNSNILNPTKKTPIYVKTAAATINIYPTTITSDVSCNCIFKPSAPSFGFVVVNGKALYNSNTSTNFSLHASEENNLVYKILEYAGVAIKDFNLSEAAFRERITSKNEKNN